MLYGNARKRAGQVSAWVTKEGIERQDRTSQYRRVRENAKQNKGRTGPGRAGQGRNL